MHKETRDLYMIQENCSDLLRIAIEKMNKKPVKPMNILRKIYQDAFININEQTLRGIYYDRQRNLTRIQRSKTTC